MKKVLLICAVLFAGMVQACITDPEHPKTKAELIQVAPITGECFAPNADIDYVVAPAEGTSASDIKGFEIRFGPTANGPWDDARYIESLSWHCEACHQGTYEQLFWQARFVFSDGTKGKWVTTWHKVGTCEAPAPIVATPQLGSCYAPNATIKYSVTLPAGISASNVSGIEISFQNLDGSWDAPRSIPGLEWICYSCHQGTYDQLYWRVRLVGTKSAYATSWHKVGICS